MKEKKVKEKTIAFRVDSESFKELERLSKLTGAGTAHNFARELAEKVINRAGAVDMWSGDHEPEYK